MCCDLCEYYYRCEDTERESVLCCGKCDDQNDCRGTAVSGRHMMDYDEYDDDLLDDADGYDDEDNDDEADEEEDYEEDDYNDSISIH